MTQSSNLAPGVYYRGAGRLMRDAKELVTQRDRGVRDRKVIGKIECILRDLEWLDEHETGVHQQTVTS